MTATPSHYIDNEFRDLAGPYDPISRQEMAWMDNVVKDLKRNPSIEYRIENHPNGWMVQRRGMIVANG